MDRNCFSRQLVRVSCLLGVLLCGASAAFAQSQMKPFPPKATTPITGVDAPYFKDGQLGDQVHFGDNGSPGQGYPHRNMTDVHYGLWYRPNGLQGQTDWCKPERFNPRGNGYPKQTSCMRLDYAPYQVATPNSQYGPYYYPRAMQHNCCVEEHDDRKNWFKLW